LYVRTDFFAVDTSYAVATKKGVVSRRRPA